MRSAGGSWFSAAPIALLVAGLFFEAFSSLRVSGAVSLGDALVLASGAAVIVLAVRREARIWAPWWLLAALPLFLAGPVVDALVYGTGTRDDFVYTATLVYCIFVLPVIIASQRPDPRNVAWLLGAWVVGNALDAFIAYLQFHNFDLGILLRWTRRFGSRVAGVNENPNILSDAMTITFPMALALALDARRPLRALAWGVMAALCLHAADISGSRASIAAAGISALALMALFAINTRQSDVLRRVVQFVLLIGIPLAYWHLRARYQESAIERLLGHASSARESSYERQHLIETGLEIIRQQPFLGEGYGRLMAKAHSVWLSLLQGGGLLGLVGFVITQLGFFVVAARLYFVAREGRISQAMALGLAGVWAAWLALGLYQIPVLARQVHIAFGLSVLCWATFGRAASLAGQRA